MKSGLLLFLATGVSLFAQTVQTLEVRCYKDTAMNGTGAHLQLPVAVTEKTESFQCEALIHPPKKVVDHGLRCVLMLSGQPGAVAAEQGDYVWSGLEFYRGVSRHAGLRLGGEKQQYDDWRRLPGGTPVLVRIRYDKGKSAFAVSCYVDGKPSSAHTFPVGGKTFRLNYFSVVSLNSRREKISDVCTVSDIKVNGQEILPPEMKKSTLTPKNEQVEAEFRQWLDGEGRRGLPVRGTPLFNTFDWDNFPHGDFSYAGYRLVPVTGRGFSTALRMEGLKKPLTFHTVQIASKRNEQPIRKGDVIFLRFDARCLASSDESGDGSVSILLVADSATWVSLGGVSGSFGRDWQTFYGYGVARSDFPAGTVRLQVYLSSRMQTVEIGGITALNLASTVEPGKLPENRLEYKERPSEAWRQKARDRIERIRKSDFRITVLDSNGVPVPGTRVNIELEKHAYGFGCYTDSGYLTAAGPGPERFRREFKRLFNRAVVPMFWGPGTRENNSWGWENPRIAEDYRKNAAWCTQNGIVTQGHVLVWPTALYAPPDVKPLLTSPDRLQARILGHIRDIIAANRRNVREWQVLNETLGTPQFGRIVGRKGMAEWFREAARCAPGSPLVVNDNGIISRFAEKQDGFEALIRQLQEDGAPVGGIGFQGHIGTEMPGPERIWAIFDRFAGFKLPIHVTEFTVQLGEHEDLQAEYTRDFLTACFSHPASASVTNWGFWAGKHYHPSCALFRRDWSPRPNGKVYEDLVLKQWHTKLSGRTGPDGSFQGRGFQGEYSGSAEIGGGKRAFRFSIRKDGDNRIVVR